MCDDAERFRALFESEFVAIVGYATRRLDDPTAAADVAADVFLIGGDVSATCQRDQRLGFGCTASPGTLCPTTREALDVEADSWSVSAVNSTSFPPPRTTPRPSHRQEHRDR